MTKGDLVHIPQDAFLIKDDAHVTWQTTGQGRGDYLRVKKPLKVLFWEKDIKNPGWASIYYRDQIWSVRMRDIYPILQEIENAS